MTMTNEPTTGEIVRALRCVADATECKDCRYKYPVGNVILCDHEQMNGNAADRLEQQEQRITELERELAAAKEDMNKVGNCTICAKNCKPSELVAIVGNGEKCFEWRGAREGEGK